MHTLSTEIAQVNAVPYYGVAVFDEAEAPPFVFRVTYTDRDEELMSEAELRRYRVSSWREVPSRYHKTLKRHLGGRMRGVAAADAAAVAAPAAYNKLIIRKQFSGQWYYGVATFPYKPVPYVYQIT
jgi:hypothetical protein